jgi:hypothetical protein
MPFTKKDYSDQFLALQELMTTAGADYAAAIEEGNIHVSLHHDTISMAAADVGSRGAICYTVVSEIQPLDRLNGRDPALPRRSDVGAMRSFTIYFFADGERVHTSNVTPGEYLAAAKLWLKKYIRGEGEDGAAAS